MSKMLTCVFFCLAYLEITCALYSNSWFSFYFGIVCKSSCNPTTHTLKLLETGPLYVALAGLGFTGICLPLPLKC